MFPTYSLALLQEALPWRPNPLAAAPHPSTAGTEERAPAALSTPPLRNKEWMTVGMSYPLNI